MHVDDDHRLRFTLADKDDRLKTAAERDNLDFQPQQVASFVVKRQVGRGSRDS
jgi:hypothetical protein